MPNQQPLTHLDATGAVRMVDVGDKPATTRRALAHALVKMSPETAAAVLAGNTKKGDVLATTRIAAIQAAKRTPDLIPLAHPIGLHSINVDVVIDVKSGVASITVETSVCAETGVEMEALTGASVGALALYDMVKGIERGITIEKVQLLEKSGGKNKWRREDA